MTPVFDSRQCTLGEGPLWHPTRRQLFWFDITGNRLLSRDATGPRAWAFAENVSAAGWIDHDHLLIASETALFRFNVETGARQDLCPLEADRPGTRPNDGRADLQGGFWIGTMGKKAEEGQGAIYRFYKGELRRLFASITISNAICFTPDGRHAHFCDTELRQVMRVALDPDGWPQGDPQVFLDLAAERLNPDGAVVDAAGTLWLALWGAGRVAAYAPDGRLLRSVPFAAPHTSCPAFGGADLATLYCTTARQGMSPEALERYPLAGQTFAAPGIGRGQPEPHVIL
ncbi:SMP-30/gluconolactonase/LRE family protein [Paracoccaceae bacterium Fryx2]|nr:SMP-30/gluconolactonase/LRE family protein [Paracoccaceae bacterium Fryx2]